MSKSNGNSDAAPPTPPAITTLSVAGFKSILDEQTIEIRPLTLLAGANSSGKSSMLQPLLLLKQTLEGQYDPGPLLLSGPNAKFTSVSQFWPVHSTPADSTRFAVTIGASGNTKIGLAFRWSRKHRRLVIDHTHYYFDGSRFELSEKTPRTEIVRFLADRLGLHTDDTSGYEQQLKGLELQIRRERSFLEVVFVLERSSTSPESFSLPSILSPRRMLARIMEVIHLPGLRGNPERTYPVTAVTPTFPGTFESYVASLISHWMLSRRKH